MALDELKIVGSFNYWKGMEIEEGEEASLREIESLKKLRCLDIHVLNIALAAQPLRLSLELLVQFRIRFGEDIYDYEALPKMDYKRRVSLNFGDGNDIINWDDLSNNIFLTHTEYLCPRGDNQGFNLNLATTQSIRWLRLRWFGNKKNITSIVAAFPLLKFLSLGYLENLEEIWDDTPIPSNSFNNLKHLKLVGLRAVKRMGKSVLSTSIDLFLQLESIMIQNCEEIEHLLVLVPNEKEQQQQDEENNLETILKFPKLKTLCLHHLPKLRSMISSSNRGIESIQFPLLAQIEILGCEKLKCLVPRDDHEEEEDQHYHDDDSLHIFCHSKVSFPNLKFLCLIGNMESKNVWCDQIPICFFTRLVGLHIGHYIKSRRLFSSSKVPQNLLNLQTLQIMNCREMVKVIEVIEDKDVSLCDHIHTTEHSPLFPSLQEIELSGLPKLESFCEWRFALELPSLKKLRIEYYHEMKSFNATGSPIITPALQIITIDDQDLESVGDLNVALHQQSEKAKVTS